MIPSCSAARVWLPSVRVERLADQLALEARDGALEIDAAGAHLVVQRLGAARELDLVRAGRRRRSSRRRRASRRARWRSRARARCRARRSARAPRASSGAMRCGPRPALAARARRGRPRRAAARPRGARAAAAARSAPRGCGSRDRRGSGPPRPRARGRGWSRRRTRTSTGDRLRSRRRARSMRSWSARSSLACTVGAISPISSRNSVPPCAASNWPMRRSCAPVKAPFSWPKSSLSSSVSRDRGAVDDDEALVAARAEIVDGARDQLLAGAALAGDQHRRARRRRRARWCGRRRASPRCGRSGGPRRARPATWSRRRTTSCSSARRSRSWRTLMRSASISNGLVTKSTAPSFIASTAVATVRVAESTITGRRVAALGELAQEVEAGAAGHHEVEQHRVDGSLVERASAASTSPTGVTSNSSLSSIRSDSRTPGSSSTTRMCGIGAQSLPRVQRWSWAGGFGGGKLDRTDAVALDAGLRLASDPPCARTTASTAATASDCSPKPSPSRAAAACGARSAAPAPRSAAGGGASRRRGRRARGTQRERALEQQREARSASCAASPSANGLRAVELFEHDEPPLVDQRSLALEESSRAATETSTGPRARRRERAELGERLDHGLDAARVGLDALRELRAEVGVVEAAREHRRVGADADERVADFVGDGGGEAPQRGCGAAGAARVEPALRRGLAGWDASLMGFARLWLAARAGAEGAGACGLSGRAWLPRSDRCGRRFVFEVEIFGVQDRRAEVEVVGRDRVGAAGGEGAAQDGLELAQVAGPGMRVQMRRARFGRRSARPRRRRSSASIAAGRSRSGGMRIARPASARASGGSSAVVVGGSPAVAIQRTPRRPQRAGRRRRARSSSRSARWPARSSWSASSTQTVSRLAGRARIRRRRSSAATRVEPGVARAARRTRSRGSAPSPGGGSARAVRARCPARRARASGSVGARRVGRGEQARAGRGRANQRGEATRERVAAACASRAPPRGRRASAARERGAAAWRRRSRAARRSSASASKSRATSARSRSRASSTQSVARESRRVAMGELELDLEVAGHAEQHGARRRLRASKPIGAAGSPTTSETEPASRRERFPPARVAMHDPELGHDVQQRPSPRERRADRSAGTRGKRRAKRSDGLGHVQRAGTEPRKRAPACAKRRRAPNRDSAQRAALQPAHASAVVSPTLGSCGFAPVVARARPLCQSRRSFLRSIMASTVPRRARRSRGMRPRRRTAGPAAQLVRAALRRRDRRRAHLLLAARHRGATRSPIASAATSVRSPSRAVTTRCTSTRPSSSRSRASRASSCGASCTPSRSTTPSSRASATCGSTRSRAHVPPALGGEARARLRGGGRARLGGLSRADRAARPR